MAVDPDAVTEMIINAAVLARQHCPGCDERIRGDDTPLVVVVGESCGHVHVWHGHCLGEELHTAAQQDAARRNWMNN